jgi:hypothetical protein
MELFVQSPYFIVSYILYLLDQVDDEEDVLNYIQFYFDESLSWMDMFVNLRERLIKALTYECIQYDESHWFPGFSLPPREG